MALALKDAMHEVLAGWREDLEPPWRAVAGATELAAMRSTAYLVNAARGGLIDEKALKKALTDESPPVRATAEGVLRTLPGWRK